MNLEYEWLQIILSCLFKNSCLNAFTSEAYLHQTISINLHAQKRTYHVSLEIGEKVEKEKLIHKTTTKSDFEFNLALLEN